jgi:hypothetical protein
MIRASAVRRPHIATAWNGTIDPDAAKLLCCSIFIISKSSAVLHLEPHASLLQSLPERAR